MSARPESPGERFTDWAARLFDPAGRHAKPEALRGIRVLDLSVIIFGPATADFLGEHGAEVIKAGPTRVGSWISTYAQAAWGGVATLAALHWRETSGRGQMIDISGTEALMRYLEYTLLLYHGSREVRERLGGLDIAVSVYSSSR